MSAGYDDEVRDDSTKEFLKYDSDAKSGVSRTLAAQIEDQPKNFLGGFSACCSKFVETFSVGYCPHQ